MGVCRICQGGPAIFFWGGRGVCDTWPSHAFARGLVNASPNFILNGAIWCVLEHTFIFFYFQEV